METPGQRRSRIQPSFRQLMLRVPQARPGGSDSSRAKIICSQMLDLKHYRRRSYNKTTIIKHAICSAISNSERRDYRSATNVTPAVCWNLR